jgi:hypothetical protein
MDSLFEMLRKPFTQLPLEQQIVVVLIALLGLSLLVYAICLAIQRFKKGRLEARRPLTSLVCVSWRDNVGARDRENARCRDISPGGLGVELPDRIKLRTRVQFRILDKTKLAGIGEVRHCTPLGSNYLIGMRFQSVSHAASASPFSSVALHEFGREGVRKPILTESAKK